MKKLFGIAAVLSVLFVLPGVSYSYDNHYTYSYGPRPYFSGQLGVSFLTDSDWAEPGYTETYQFDPGFATSFASGARFGIFRIEGEVGYQTNDMDKIKVCSGGDCFTDSFSTGDMSALSFLGNFYIDFINASPVTPFITAGMGVARVEANDLGGPGYDYDDTGFAYQVGAGLAFAVNPNLTIDLKYRYFATEDNDFEGANVKFASHNVYGGLRFTF